MADDSQPENDKVWDEYDWERFLQQQDRKTERYMELLEKYIDHPDRDQIIAREMGWTHLLNEDGERWAEEVEEMFEEEMSEDDDAEDDDTEGEADAEGENYEVHPLYQASFALTVWLDQLFDEREDLQNHPSAVKLSTQAAICSAKLAAALSDDDIDEIGMTIAYLKRALKAITSGMEAALQLRKEIPLDEDRYGTLNQRLFQIRDSIIDLMGEYRAEFRRRHGAA
jgi:phage pi2 protein 07